MKVKPYMLSVVLFLTVVSLFGCDGGGSNSTGPSSTIVGSWGGYWQVYGTYVTLTFKADGKYEEVRANLQCKFTGTYVLGTWPNGSGKITVTKTGGFCGMFTESVVVNWSYRIEGDYLWIMGDIRMEKVAYPG